MPFTSHGFTRGTSLFLDASHTGTLATSESTAANTISKPVAYVIDANNLLISNMRGIQNTTGGGGGSGGSGSDVTGLSANWQNTWLNVNTNSGNWDTTYTRVASAHNEWDKTNTTLRANSGHWTTIVKDQGSTITGNASAFNFVGNGVVATVDTTGTVQVSSFDATGGGGGGSSRTDFEIMMAASVFR